MTPVINYTENRVVRPGWSKGNKVFPSVPGPAFAMLRSPVGGDEGVYVLVRRTLVQLEYHHRLSKPDKGLVKRYLEKVTGLSRSQLTRLIGLLRTGKIKDRRGKVPARPFERRYTQSDIRLLAELLNQISGAVLRRDVW